MKELLYKSVYREVFYYPEINLIELIYLEGSSTYTDEEYKRETNMFYAFFEERKVEFYCVDSVQFDYIIIPEMQEWLKKTVTPVLIKHQLKKMAIITSADVFIRVSLRQMADKITKEASLVEKKYFTSVQKAREWLVE